MDKDGNGILEDFRIEFIDFWGRLPNKAFFLTLFALWMGIFLLLGNSTLGYVHSPSLFRWVLDAYHPAGKYFESDDGHGILVPLVVLVIFWVKRKQLLAAPLEMWWPGLLILGCALALHLAGYLIQQPRVSLIAFFMGLYGLMGLAWGPRWLRQSLFPFFLFIFCVPLSTQLQAVTFYLRLVVCWLVEAISHSVLAIDIIREGTSLRDPTGAYQYEVAAACSGLRSLFATLGMAFCFAFMSLNAWWKRVGIILSAFPLAVLGNLVRMMTIVIAAEVGGQEWGNWAHDGGPMGIVSLIPYIPAFFGLVYLEQWLHKLPDSAPPRNASTRAASRSGATEEEDSE